MENSGLILAFDKSHKKIELLQKNMNFLGVKNVRSYACNSAKLLGNSEIGKEPYDFDGVGRLQPCTFDFILLDPPCTGFGQRPDFEPLLKTGPVPDFEEHSSFQKVLFDNAYGLLKHGGYMVYSTCSMSIQENEKLVVDMLGKYPSLELIRCGENMPALAVDGLNVERQKYCCRFWAMDETVGFYIAKFRKN